MSPFSALKLTTQSGSKQITNSRKCKNPLEHSVSKILVLLILIYWHMNVVLSDQHKLFAWVQSSFWTARNKHALESTKPNFTFKCQKKWIKNSTESNYLAIGFSQPSILSLTAQTNGRWSKVNSKSIVSYLGCWAISTQDPSLLWSLLTFSKFWFQKQQKKL